MDENSMNHFMDFETSNRNLEKMNEKQTLLHEMNPFVKIILTILYLGLVLSYSQYELDGLIIFLAYPILTVLLSEIPIGDVMKRVMLILPFIIFIGLSNILLNRNMAFILAGIVITKGMISFLTIILKAGMSVSMLYILIATTDTKHLMIGLRMLHIPNIFLVQFELMLRYIGVLVEEARNMYYAYRLRMPGVKGVVIKHMGEFLGQLLLKSMNRSERIYHAMKCRGFHGNISTEQRERLQRKDYLQLGIISIVMILCRVIKVF